MAAYPWYLLAAGAVLLVVGILAASLGQPSGSRNRPVDPRMSDEDIARNLQGERPATFASLLILLGLLCVFVSVVWRLARFFF